MKSSSSQGGEVRAGGESVALTRRVIRERYHMLAPENFVEEPALVASYTYLLCREKSPLGIAIKHVPFVDSADREKKIFLYFHQPSDALEQMPGAPGPVYYRETVTSSQYMGVYSLRFAVMVEGGVLFGCFNSSADDRDAWRPVVLKMLRSVEADSDNADARKRKE